MRRTPVGTCEPTRAARIPIGTSQDFEALLEDRGFDTSQISAIGMGTTGFGGKVRREGGEWGNIFIHGMDEGLIADSALMFQQRAEGYPG